MIPPVVASERGTAQTSWRRKALAGVVGPRHCTEMVSGSIWKVTSQKVIILYTKPNAGIAVS